ncbi:hypothetical protein WOLCODRAFT_156707 [Wolfiporia cocos MD-104 SS10]|uniref:Uncharacterized protein n=1 Tax=Wolfiporia cocos (strain MD-104) TaxID=742152 RepID=A0A2H3JJ24_WOLCO|nr:hypothetical protein WOLCODRAFT_156707 [Wolfiporia cocos MD-104 SS10]
MARLYRVFSGAPAAHDLGRDPRSYRWQTVSSATIHPCYPPATLEAASRRISLLYQNIIFGDSEEEEYVDAGSTEHDGSPGIPRNFDGNSLITWSPTVDESRFSRFASTTGPTFIRASASISRVRFGETQETQDTGSFNYSEASSIARFPQYHFNLNSVISLSHLIAQSRQQAEQTKAQKGFRKVTTLAAVLEVEGPDTVRIKHGAEAGKEVSLLKFLLGDEGGGVCKLTAWRETAERWGGADPGASAPALKRGDVVLLEDVLATWTVDPGRCDGPTGGFAVAMTASGALRSRAEICYRTMPYTHQDNRLRPDLRLGCSDAAVRKVVAVVRWFEALAGLPARS